VLARRCARVIVGASSDCSAVLSKAPPPLDMHKFSERQPNRRIGHEPPGPAVPGFYRVRTGSLVEIGDQTLDERGLPHPISLDQVGRQVTPGSVVLRIDRRQQHD
jgi:hypothetical protein